MSGQALCPRAVSRDVLIDRYAKGLRSHGSRRGTAQRRDGKRIRPAGGARRGSAAATTAATAGRRFGDAP